MYTAVYMCRVITCHGITAQQQSAFTLEAGPQLATKRSLVPGVLFFSGGGCSPILYLVRTYLVSYCRSVRQQRRFNDPTLKPRSVFGGGCIKNSSISSKRVHCCIHVSRDHVSREHSTAAVGFHFGGRPRNWQRSARWYQAFCS